MTRTLTILTILFTLSYLVSAQSLIENDSLINLTDLYFIKVGNESLQNDLNDTILNFFISGAKDLKTINNKFSFQESNEELFCGFDYIIYRTSKNQITKTFAFNLKCSYALIDEEPFKLHNDSSILIPKKGTAFSDYVTFDNLKKARKALEKALIDTTVYLVGVERYIWVDFDGYFNITTKESPTDLEKQLRQIDLNYKLETSLEDFPIHLYKVYSN